MNLRTKKVGLLLGLAVFCLFAAPKPLTAEIVSRKTDRTVVAESGVTQAIQSNFVLQGMSESEASSVVNQMSAEEISYYGENPDRSQVGGDAAAGLIIFVLVVVVLVYLIVFLGQRT